jgi:DNA-binding transcriptional LysR family regulator
MARIRTVAPSVRLVVVQQLPRQEYKRAMENGEVDLAIGQLPSGQSDLVQQLLSMEPFDGYARVGHPILHNPTLEAFLQAYHLVVGRPTVSEAHVQKALGHHASERRVFLRLRHYLSAALALAQTDLIAVLPRNVSEFVTSSGKVARFPPPLEIEPVAIRQFWHARSTNDEGAKWLRGQIAALFRRSST